MKNITRSNICLTMAVLILTGGLAVQAAAQQQIPFNDPTATTCATPSGNTFTRTLGIADIVAVNGQPVMGTHARGAIGNLRLNTAPGPGVAIADTVRAAVAVFTF